MRKKLNFSQFTFSNPGILRMRWKMRNDVVSVPRESPTMRSRGVARNGLRVVLRVRKHCKYSFDRYFVRILVIITKTFGPMGGL